MNIATLPVLTLPHKSYEEIQDAFEQHGISRQTTPIIRPTPCGDLICYLREEVYYHSWDVGGTTYYYPISLGHFPTPVYFKPHSAT